MNTTLAVETRRLTQYFDGFCAVASPLLYLEIHYRAAVSPRYRGGGCPTLLVRGQVSVPALVVAATTIEPPMSDA